MPTWTKQQYEDWRIRHIGSTRLCPSITKPDTGKPLERVAPGETKGCKSPPERYHIRFCVFRKRPLDWDNHFIKPLQDCLVETDIIPDDNWNILQGEIGSRKANSKSEERTEITITRLT